MLKRWLLFIVIFGTIFFPLVSNEATRYPVQVSEAQSVSVLLRVWGTSCGEPRYNMVGEPYDLGATLYLWTEESECINQPFYLQTTYFWAKYVCLGYNSTDCIRVSTP